MRDNPRTMFVNVYDRDGTIQSSYRNLPEEKKRIPRMEITVTADEHKVDQLRELANGNDASFNVKNGSLYEIFIGTDSDRYDFVTRNVSFILFAEA